MSGSTFTNLALSIQLADGCDQQQRATAGGMARDTTSDAPSSPQMFQAPECDAFSSNSDVNVRMLSKGSGNYAR